MAHLPIKIEASIAASPQKTWDYYTLPEHIINWNYADPSWHCPAASNDLSIGGKYFARMEAKDGSFGFDFEARYTKLVLGQELYYAFDGRNVRVLFENTGIDTRVTIEFDPENENPIELQKEGWQAILNNFKSYTEAN